MDKKNQRPEFHGSDLEKIAAYYHIPASEIPGIIKFGANVNPLGLSESVKNDLAGHLDIISSYPDRNYTSLKKTIGEYCHISPKHIVVGNGSTELISLLISQRQAKKALVVGPTYSEYERELALTGGTITEYNLKEDLNFQLDMQDFFASMADDVDLLILCNPNNPTGAVYPKEILEQIVQIAREKELIIFSDEIYDRLVMDGYEHTSIASLAPDVFCVTFSGLSKSHMIAGFRIGWMILSGAKDKAKGYIEGIKMLSSMRLCSNVPAQSIVQTALGGYQSVTEYIKPGGRVYEQRECIYNALKDIPGISVVKPHAAFYIFPKIDTEKFNITNDEQFALDFLHEKQVLIVPGKGFNWMKPDHFRIVYLPNIRQLEKSMEKLREFLRTYQQR